MITPSSKQYGNMALIFWIDGQLFRKCSLDSQWDKKIGVRKIDLATMPVSLFCLPYFCKKIGKS